MPYLIGVDGGATKSSALIADINGKIIGEKTGKALNYIAVGEDKSRENLKKLLQPFLKQYRGKIKKIVIGFAGLNFSKDLIIYKKIVKSVLPRSIKFYLFNDAKIALEDACPDWQKPRILIISGTGSSAYGEYKKKQAKALNQDFIMGEQGSAYWIGLRALQGALQSWDGREKKSILEKLVVKRENSKDIPDLIAKVYRTWHRKPQELKKYIASFAPVVGEAYLRKDSLAKKIIEDAAQELMRGVEAVGKRLEIRHEAVCVGFVGSTFKAPGLLGSFKFKIKKIYPRVRFVYDVNPVKGALNLAIRLP